MLEEVATEENKTSVPLDLENIALNSARNGVLLKFKEGTEENIALRLIARWLGEFYGAELGDKPYFNKLKIEPGKPAKDGRPKADKLAYILRIQYRSHITKQTSKRSLMVLGFFNILPWPNPMEWTYEIKFDRRNDDFSNEKFVTDYTITTSEVRRFYDYVNAGYGHFPKINQSTSRQHH